MKASDYIAIAALIVAAPAMIIGIVNAVKNTFHLACSYKISRRVDLYKDYDKKTPSDFRRMFGVLEYINYSPIDFYINKIDLRIKDKSFPVEQMNDKDRDIMRIVYPVIPFKNIPLYQRSSGEIQLVVDLPKNVKIQSGKIYVYTSYRRKPYKYPIYDLSQSQQ